MDTILIGHWGHIIQRSGAVILQWCEVSLCYIYRLMPEPVNSPPRPEPFRWNAVCVLEGPHIPFSTEQRWRNQNRRWEFATQKVFNHNATGSEWILEQSSQLKCAFCERCSGLNSDSQQAGWEGPQELSFCKLDLSGEPLSWMSVGSAPPPSPSLILTLMYQVSRGFVKPFSSFHCHL